MNIILHLKQQTPLVTKKPQLKIKCFIKTQPKSTKHSLIIEGLLVDLALNAKKITFSP